jgi:phage virion morphogenesis protein
MSKRGTSFELDFSGLDQLVGNALVGVGQTRQLMSEVGEVFVAGVQERFEEGKDPEGREWKPSKRAESDGGKTLVDKGQLRDSYGYQASAERVDVGSADVRARIHQMGGKTGRGHSVEIDARPVLPPSEEDIEEVKGLVADHMAATIGGRR